MGARTVGTEPDAAVIAIWTAAVVRAGGEAAGVDVAALTGVAGAATDRGGRVEFEGGARGPNVKPRAGRGPAESGNAGVCRAAAVGCCCWDCGACGDDCHGEAKGLEHNYETEQPGTGRKVNGNSQYPGGVGAGGAESVESEQ